MSRSTSNNGNPKPRKSIDTGHTRHGALKSGRTERTKKNNQQALYMGIAAAKKDMRDSNQGLPS